jgi:hypothetical protein
MAQTGFRSHRLIPYDEEFRMMTLPTTTKGTALVFPGKGVKINHIHYWSGIFRSPTVENRRVPIRYDPYDAGVAYAYIGSRWVSCFSERYPAFRGRSEREMMLAAAEVRRRWRDHSRNLELTARKLADFVTSVEAEEVLLLQRLRDAEAKSMRHIAGGHPAQSRSAATHPYDGQMAPANGDPARYEPHVPELFEEY